MSDNDNDTQREHPLKGKLEEIGRRLAEKRSRKDLEEIQLELSVLEQWDRVMLKSNEGGHHHHHDDDDTPDGEPPRFRIPDPIRSGPERRTIDAGTA
jgi:hypothetical protein